LGSPATDGRPPLPRTTNNSSTSSGIGSVSGIGGGIGGGSGAGVPMLSRQRTFDYTPINPNPSLNPSPSERSDGLVHSVVDVVHRLGSVDSVGSGGSIASSGSGSIHSGIYDVNGKRKVDEVVPGANTLGTSTSGGISGSSGTSGASGMDGGDVISPAKKLKGAWPQPRDDNAQVRVSV